MAPCGIPTPFDRADKNTGSGGPPRSPRKPQTTKRLPKRPQPRKSGDPYGTRTRVSALRGPCPKPLDERAAQGKRRRKRRRTRPEPNPRRYDSGRWLRRKDSNLRLPDPESGVLPAELLLNGNRRADSRGHGGRVKARQPPAASPTPRADRAPGALAPHRAGTAGRSTVISPARSTVSARRNASPRRPCAKRCMAFAIAASTVRSCPATAPARSAARPPS